ncbi:MAG TPA: hypothetical protein VJS40_00195 [Aestuariivirgaceae bacterium]|nr:hypothetical protein [Aestuariivirgaceae bacterium]
MARGTKSPRSIGQASTEPYRGDRSEVTAAIAILVGAAAALGCFIWFGAVPEQRASLLLTGVLGGVSGWGAGILLTPYKSDEAPSDLQKMLLSGLVGYLLAKFNTLADVISGLGVDGTGSTTLLPFAAVALTLFICALALTYVHRTYKMSQSAREAAVPPRPVKPKPERQTAPRRPIAVPRLPLEGLTAKLASGNSTAAESTN